jgi:dihydrofolate synthase/folylpolyglutamate synthase
VAEGAAGWSAAESESYLAGLEPIGWKLGLERMRRLSAALGHPQHRFASIHVVGTNGKSSTALMTAALLAAHGVRAGAHVSPHLRSWRERVQVGGEPIGEEAFAASVERTAAAVEAVDRALGEGEAVTQFEAATAAAFVALAAEKVEVGVIEAGLGGRLDATNTIPSRLTVLTSVGLDHTQWLGETKPEIAAEKLAVLRDHTTLVTGPLDEEIAALARRTAAERHARFVAVEAGGPYPARNFAVACAAAAEFLGADLDTDAVRAVEAGIAIPGRLQLIDDDPPLLLDAAHNPDGARALVEALPGAIGDRPVVALLAVLSDKDARGIAEALAPACEAIVCTEIPAEAMRGSGRPGAGSLPAAELARLAGAGAEALPDAGAALARARRLAAERGAVLLITGSHYLLGESWTARPVPS